MQDNVYGQLSLTLPVGAAPGEPQIRLGNEVPTCMQAAYKSVILEMPTGWNAGIGAAPSRFIGVRTGVLPGTSAIDSGWVVWDGLGTVCGYIVTDTFGAFNTGAGVLNMSTDMGTAAITGGAGVSGGTITNTIGRASGTTLTRMFGDFLHNLSGGYDHKIQDSNSAGAVSIDRGVRMFAASQANSGAIGVALTDVLTMVNVVDGTANWTPEPLRSYEVLLGGGYSTAAGQRPGWILVYGAGTQICGWDWQPTQVGANASHLNARTIFKSSATPAAMTNIRVQMLSTAAAGANWLGNGNVSRYCEIRDLGAVNANAYQNLPTV